MTSDTTTAKSRRKTKPAPRAKRVTKKVQLIRMLDSSAGADIATISAKLGWQTHTTRAALTGLRKAGHEIVAEKQVPGKPARYRIVRAPAARAEALPADQIQEAADAG